MYFIVSDKVAVSGVWFDHSECNHPRWAQMEEALVSSSSNGFLPPTFRPTLQVFTDKTDNRYSPIGFVGGQYDLNNVMSGIYICIQFS